MSSGALRLLRAADVQRLLDGREATVLDAVRLAYVAHANSATGVPGSTFLRFPTSERARIIALPAFVGEPLSVAGVKWIASFPENHAKGLDRASAVVVLNSLETGVPYALLEASQISAKRTAASAALAARYLAPSDLREAAIIGCGPINFEVTRFLTRVFPELRAVEVFDVDPARALMFCEKISTQLAGVKPRVGSSLASAMASARLASFATNATTPHVPANVSFVPGATVLHVSLRDFAPETILAHDNVVDDVDHVCSAETSVHLAERQAGGRDFIRTTIGEIAAGRTPPRARRDATTIFSPFGLGVLDLAVSKLVMDLAESSGSGMMVENFLPTPWAAAVR